MSDYDAILHDLETSARSSQTMRHKAAQAIRDLTAERDRLVAAVERVETLCDHTKAMYGTADFVTVLVHEVLAALEGSEDGGAENSAL